MGKSHKKQEAGFTLQAFSRKDTTRKGEARPLVVYQIGGLITGEVGFNIFTIVAVAIIVFTIYMLVRPNKYLNDNEVKIDVKKVAASK